MLLLRAASGKALNTVNKVKSFFTLFLVNVREYKQFYLILNVQYRQIIFA